jgi:hypothetical protein
MFQKCVALCSPLIYCILPFNDNILPHEDVRCPMTCEEITSNFTILLLLFTVILPFLLIVYLISSVLGHV